MSQEKPTGSSQPNKDPVFPIWRIEEKVREQILRGVKTSGGAEVAVSVGSSTFTYIRKIGNELTVKYIDRCAVVTATANLVGDEVKVNNVTIHNICSEADI
jgi:hypothetical protein